MYEILLTQHFGYFTNSPDYLPESEATRGLNELMYSHGTDLIKKPDSLLDVVMLAGRTYNVIGIVLRPRAWLIIHLSL